MNRHKLLCLIAVVCMVALPGARWRWLKVRRWIGG